MPMISLQNVSYFRKGKTILDEVSWQVKAGENWVILGLNGSGKTTLLQLINGYIFPSSGSMEVLGYQFGRSSLPELRKHIGWISSALTQQIPPYDHVLDVVLSGRFSSLGLWEKTTAEDEKKAYEILEFLGMLDMAQRGYASLSQGEQQKVMIGRALMNDPEIIIFDEAFNGLDIIARHQMEGFVKSLANEERSILFVTHQTDEIMPFFDKVLFLKKGRKYASGRQKDMLKEDQLKDFYGENVDVFFHKERYFISIKD